MRSLTLLTNDSFELQRTSSVRCFRDSKRDARNLHCLTSSNECTSEAAIALNVLRVDSWSLQILRKYEILLHKIWAHIVGQFRVRRGIVFEVDFGSCKMCLPTSAWNDSSLFKRVLLRVHDSEPYMRTGMTQLSTRLFEESGLSHASAHAPYHTLCACAVPHSLCT